MRLFCDENIGKGVPTALRAVGFDATYLRKVFRSRLKSGQNIPDEVWIPIVGQRGWLAFTSDTAILEAEAQRNLMISENLGAVFLTTGQGNNVELLKMLRRRWDWLETIDRTPRPFAYCLTMNGRWKRDARV